MNENTEMNSEIISEANEHHQISNDVQNVKSEENGDQNVSSNFFQVYFV
jgi:hypothetical protein